MSRVTLVGKVALVTGAGSATGIGNAIARALATAGAEVVLGDIDIDGATRNAAAIGAAGRVIWISSVAGKQGGGIIGTAHYAASKAGVIGLCQAAARELGPYGITSNAIAPGFILTGIATKALDANQEVQLDRTISNTAPVRRSGVPEDVAAAALFLASEEASYVTGDVMNVNGGIYFD